MLKFCVLFLNYKCPNQCVFCCFYGFICDFLEFPTVKSSKIFTAHRTQRIRILNTKKVGFVKAVFFDFFKFVFHRCQKTGLTDFPGKRAPNKVKYLSTVCQILWNFTEGNSKIHSQFCFLCSCLT